MGIVDEIQCLHKDFSFFGTCEAGVSSGQLMSFVPHYLSAGSDVVNKLQQVV